ncbi:MAG TPA: exodeoxyribonuclease III [Terracidiphilus sp.]|jgi:exodeoxyribonuclease-3
MKIATWNVNSIRARIEHVKRWLSRQNPDVLMMQEIKGEVFPAEVFEPLGYHSVAVTQKTYNGVAILSRSPIEVTSTTLPGDSEDSHARFLETRINGLRVVNIYAPNGNPPRSEKFTYKLEWMDRLSIELHKWLADRIPTVIGGDYNVIPEDIDCHKPSSWMHDALFQPEPRARYREWTALGYADAFRHFHPDETGQFTYWDYFRLAFEHNRGIRIDHFLLSPSLAPRAVACHIDREPRAEPKPSDHTPVLLELL